MIVCRDTSAGLVAEAFAQCRVEVIVDTAQFAVTIGATGCRPARGTECFPADAILMILSAKRLWNF